MFEKQLIEGCCKKDRKAQRALFEAYFKPVFRLVKRYIGDHHESEDITSIVFNKAFKNIDNFEYRGEGSLRKWLNTIGVNESLRALKKVKRLQFQEEDIEVAPLEVAESHLDIRKVNAILQKMPRGYRTVFNLYTIDRYSHSEIAEVLNISRNTSKSQLLKARRFIINELNKSTSYGAEGI
jgi:RNA polymerase sigma-70 factor (ECF subfamily)